MDGNQKRPNVGKASSIMFLSLVLSRCLGLIRDMVMSRMFGSSGLTDSYSLAFSIPDLLFFLIAGGALSSAFIPVFSEYLHTEREQDAWQIFSTVVSWMSAVIIGFIIFAWIFATPLAHQVAPGKTTPEQIELIAHMSRILLPAQFAFFIGGLMFGTLYARQVFAVPGLGPNIYNIGIIFGAIVISHYVDPSITGMAWGALVGAFLGNIAVPLIVMRKMGSKFSISFDTKHPGVRQVFRLMIPVVLGLSLPGVFAILMRGMASYFPDGVNTYLDYGNKLMQAPLGIFGQSLAIAVFPALTQFFAQDRMDLFRDQLSKTVRTVIYLTVPISLFMIAMPDHIVGLIYEGGKFKPTDTHAVASCLAYFSIGISAWCMHPVLMRGYFAIQNSVVPVVIGTLTTGIFFATGKVLAGAMGYTGLPLAASISAILLVAMLSYDVSRRVGGLDVSGIIATFIKSFSVSAVLAGGCYLIGHSDFGQSVLHHKFALLLFVGVMFVALTGLYSAATSKLDMPETAYLDRATKRFKKQP